MPFKLGVSELTIILVIIVLLFGVGRISKVAGELGSGLKAFRKGLEDDDINTESEKDEQK